MRRRRPEDAIQRAVFQHIRACGVAGLVAIHVPNGGFRRLTEAKILVGLGVTAGVPDILLWHDGKSFALELKAGAGQVSSAQVEMLNRLANAGVATAVCCGLDSALVTLEGWELLRGKAQTYDVDDDIRKSVAEGFRAIRARKAAGGPGWIGGGDK
jgi:hypothetical protein